MKSDEELVLLAQKGDTDSELEVFSRYKNLLRKISRSFFLIGGEIEDLLQEGMIGLYKAIKSFNHLKNASFAGFAGLCIKRQIQTAIKRASSNKNLVLSSALPLTNYGHFDEEDEESFELVIPSSDPSPDEILISEESLDEIKKNIKSKLTSLEIKVLSKYLNGQSYKEIAKQTSLNEKSIDNALTRIKKKLAFLKN